MAYRWVILFFGIVAYATTQFSRQNYSGVQKFIAEDFHLDKAALGVLGSVFFYCYALFQMPWGVATDKLGSRWTTGLSILLTAGTMVGFAASQTENQLLFFRALSGVAAAAVYVAMAGGVARWFPPRERGFSQASLAGIGGAAGEGAAFLLLPILSIYFAAGWRQGTNIIAAAIAGLGVLCLVFLRSAPSDQPAPTSNPFDRKVLADAQLWCYTFLFAGFIIAIRVVQPWIAIYAADVYIAKNGLDVNDAVIAGGTLTVVAYSLVGRAGGCSLAGRLSDALLKRGISRTAMVISLHLLTIIAFLILATWVTPIWFLGIIAAFLGASINLYGLTTASISETYGPQKTASIVAFVNTMGQLAGATTLALSGYVGISLSTQLGNSLAEYRGIWLTALVGVGIMTAVGTTIHVALKKGWWGSSVVEVTVCH